MINAHCTAQGVSIIQFPRRPKERRRLDPVDNSAALKVRGRRVGWQPYAGPSRALEFLQTFTPGQLVMVQLDRQHGVRITYREGYALDIDAEGHRQPWSAATMRAVAREKQGLPAESTALPHDDAQRLRSAMQQAQMLLRAGQVHAACALLKKNSATIFPQPVDTQQPNLYTPTHTAVAGGSSAPLSSLATVPTGGDSIPVEILCCVADSAGVASDGGSMVREELRKARVDLGLSQGDLAQLAQVSPSMVSQVENGKRGVRSKRHLLRIIDALRVEGTRRGLDPALFERNVLCPGEWREVAA